VRVIVISTPFMVNAKALPPSVIAEDCATKGLLAAIPAAMTACRTDTMWPPIRLAYADTALF
jgi:hypothetical protein